MNGGLLFGLFIAQLLADFVFQGKPLIDQRFSTNLIDGSFATKVKTSLLGNLKHATIYLGLSLVVLAYYYFSPWVFVPLGILFLSHLTIDFGKSLLVLKRPSAKYSILLLLVDQLFHGIINFFTAYFVSKILHHPTFVLVIFNNINSFFSSFKITVNQKVLLSILLLIVGLWGVGIFINLFLERTKIGPYKGALNKKIIFLEGDNGTGVPKGGFLIGVLERLVIIFAVVFNMITIIGFLVAAKSIARFKKFDDDAFVEYFIIGSFMSIISAIFIGILIRQLGIFPLLK